MVLLLHVARFEIDGIRFHHDEPRDLRHIAVSKYPDVVPAECMADQNIGPRNAGVVQGAVQLISDTQAGARHGTRVAETGARAIIAACACPLSDARLHDRPYWSPVFPAGIKHHRGRAASQAEILLQDTVIAPALMRPLRTIQQCLTVVKKVSAHADPNGRTLNACFG